MALLAHTSILRRSYRSAMSLVKLSRSRRLHRVCDHTSLNGPEAPLPPASGPDPAASPSTLLFGGLLRSFSPVGCGARNFPVPYKRLLMRITASESIIIILPSGIRGLNCSLTVLTVGESLAFYELICARGCVRVSEQSSGLLSSLLEACYVPLFDTLFLEQTP